METTKHSANLGLTRVHIANVSIKNTTEKVTWIRNRDLSVSLLISERIVRGKLAPPRVIGEFTEDETDEQIKAVCRDYVRRQNNRQIDPLPMRPMVLEDLREPEPEPIFDSTGRGYFGVPR